MNTEALFDWVRQQREDFDAAQQSTEDLGRFRVLTNIAREITVASETCERLGLNAVASEVMRLWNEGNHV